jgi:hypothetical protein
MGQTTLNRKLRLANFRFSVAVDFGPPVAACWTVSCNGDALGFGLKRSVRPYGS